MIIYVVAVVGGGAVGPVVVVVAVVVIIYVYMNVNPMHMHMWLSAIVPYVFLQVLETSPCRGGSVKIFN